MIVSIPRVRDKSDHWNKFIDFHVLTREETSVFGR
jgi:hypothetical protein